MLTDRRMWTPGRSPSSLTQVGSHCFPGDIPSPGFLSRTRLRQGGELGRSRAARLHTRVGSGRPRSRPRWALCSPVLPLSPLPGCGSPHPCLFHGGSGRRAGGRVTARLTPGWPARRTVPHPCASPSATLRPSCREETTSSGCPGPPHALAGSTASWSSALPRQVAGRRPLPVVTWLIVQRVPSSITAETVLAEP